MPEKHIKNQRSKLGPILVIFVGLILLVITLFLSILSRSNENSEVTVSPVSMEQITRIKPEDAFANLENSNVVFLDVRSQALYEQEHISGSINIPLAEIETRLSKLDKSKWIIAYCT